MPFQSVPNTAEVDVRGTLFGQHVENTLYFTKATPYIMADLNDLAALVRSWFFDEVLPLLSADYAFVEVFAKDLEVEAGAEATDIAEAGTTGGAASPSLPGNVSLAVSFRTGVAGRSFRGRNFVPAIPTSAKTSNSVTSTFQLAIQAAYGELLAVLEDTDFQWAVVSRVALGALRAEGISTPVIVATVVDAFIDSQRRRLEGRGQ